MPNFAYGWELFAEANTTFVQSSERIRPASILEG